MFAFERSVKMYQQARSKSLTVFFIMRVMFMPLSQTLHHGDMQAFVLGKEKSIFIELKVAWASE
jgi:hypothetical protein